MMWPILALSVITLSIVIERLFFLIAQRVGKNAALVSRIFELVEHGQMEPTLSEQLRNSRDVVVRILYSGLQHQDTGLSDAMLEQASVELEQYQRGIAVLDTAVTLGPLLGLLGTVIGMMQVFGMIPGADLAGKQDALVSGISECLLAVSFGLAVAILAIIPLNFLTAQLEKVRRQFESSMTQLELLIAKRTKS